MNINDFLKGNERAEEYLSQFINSFDQGLVLYNVKTSTVVYANDIAMNMFPLDKAIEDNYIKEDDLAKLYANKNIIVYLNDYAIKINLMNHMNDMVWLRLSSEDDFTKYTENILNANKLNKQYRKILSEYDTNSVMISDENGNIIFVGEETVENCGHDKKWYYGKNVIDLEKAKVFEPSVIRMVLETRTEQVTIQNVQNSSNLLVAVGVPIFDEKGELSRVVSLTKNFTEQINMSNLMVQMDFGMNLAKKDNDEFESIVTCNEKMLKIKELARIVAPTDSTILILGKTGTGKEVFANAIHKTSNRADRPFVVVSCGSLSPNIVESELFGYEGGAFTGASKAGKIGLLETANGGTVFLDEIGELPLEQQVKLLRVLQENCITRVGGTQKIPLDIRVMSATNRDLKKQVEEGSFREDLYYRLNVVQLEIPELYERRDDIPLLTTYFIDKYNKKYNKNKMLSKKTMALIRAYDWPGNVRELKNMVENLIVTASSNYIEEESLPSCIIKDIIYEEDVVQLKDIVPLEYAIRATEKKLLKMAKNKYRTTTEIAKVLQVNQSTVSRKMKQYNLD